MNLHEAHFELDGIWRENGKSDNVSWSDDMNINNEQNVKRVVDMVCALLCSKFL